MHRMSISPTGKSRFDELSPYRQNAVQVGVSTRLHFAELFKCPEDVPSPVLILGIPSDLMQKK